MALAALAPAVSGGTSPPRGWTPARHLDQTDADWANDVRIAVDAEGNAMAVWHQFVSGAPTFFAARYDAVWGWGDPEPIQQGVGGFYTDGLAIGVDAAGRFIVVGSLGDATRQNMWANRYTPEGGWDAPQKIDTEDLGDTVTARLAVGADGTAMAAWSQWDSGPRSNIWASRFIPGSGWTSAAKIETDDTGDAGAPELAADASGNVEAVWGQSDGVRNNIWTNRYTVGSGWGAAALLETDNAGEASDARVAADPQGGFLAAWTQYNGSVYNVLAKRYTDGAGWGAVAYAESDDTGAAYAKDLAYGTDGKAILAIQQHDGAQYNARANEYTDGVGWGVDYRVSELSDLETDDPVVAVGPSGLAIMVYERWDGAKSDAVGRVRAPGEGWGPEALLEAAGGGVDDMDVNVYGAGDAFVTWSAYDTVWSALVAQYLAPDTTAPALSLLGTTVSASSLLVTGSTEPGATVTVNGVVTGVRPDGSFSVVVPLAAGENVIDVAAWDASGNVAIASRTVTNDDPAAGLAAELAQAQADLAAQSATLASTQAQLNATLAQVTLAQATAAAAHNDTLRLQADLATANAKINQSGAGGGGAAAPSDMLPLLLGGLGIALGAAALAMGMMKRGGGGGGGGGGDSGGRLGVSSSGAATRIETPKDAGASPEFHRGEIQ